MNSQPQTLLEKLIHFCLHNQLIITLLLIFLIGWGVMTAPFDWKIDWLERKPVPVDAIPDIGENQQIVFTAWPGHSPQDVEDQLTYPLTVALLGLPDVKTVRSYSMFGFSTIYVIFKEKADFYWARSRILEKLNSLPTGSLPEGVSPTLGPDATALGQVFWYTLEGRDEEGNPAGGWDLDELRSIQDWYVRYGLMSAEGISEVASIGGFVREYQIDVDPDAMRAHQVTLPQIIQAVIRSNSEIGARTLEFNHTEYVLRGLGFIQQLSDLEEAVIKTNDHVPILLRHVAKVSLGPAERRGALDKEGSEAVGGVAVVRYGENPLESIKNLKKKIEEISPGLPVKELADGRQSKVTIIPFYDRTTLIHETLNTLNQALTEEILITIIVIVLLLMHMGSSLLISALLPISVLLSFIAMKLTNVDANIVALSGIAIAIGTMVDMGIVMTESIVRHLKEQPESTPTSSIIFNAAREVGSAVMTAVATTVISFLPVFTMEAAEGKLFRPLAFTKTYALIASLLVALFILPPLASFFFRRQKERGALHTLFQLGLFLLTLLIMIEYRFSTGFFLLLLLFWSLFRHRLSSKLESRLNPLINMMIAFAILLVLSAHWMPLGMGSGLMKNLLFVLLLMTPFLLLTQGFTWFYPKLLREVLRFRLLFLLIPFFILWLGLSVWLGAETTLGWLPESWQKSNIVQQFEKNFPGLGKEFMPPLDEGAFLYMPTTMPHASMGEILDVISEQDQRISAIPEVSSAVGKLGRAETALDPAPLSMIETIINYHPEYLVDDAGVLQTWRYDATQIDWVRNHAGKPVAAPDGNPYRTMGRFIRDRSGALIPDDNGHPFRLWRPPLDPSLNEGRSAWSGIQSPEDIWNQILMAAEIPGTTSAPILQPISARLVMLQSGMRAPMGIKVKGPDLKTIEAFGLELEKLLKQVPSVKSSAVIADRIVGKPYLEIILDRKACSRYGVNIKDVHQVIETALGGRTLFKTVEGRERYPVRIRYLRELRNTPETLPRILIPTSGGKQIPLGQLGRIHYQRGPQMIKSEDTFLIGYVLFDRQSDFSEVHTVEEARNFLEEKVKEGKLTVPPGVSYTFAGSYENQVRSERKLRIVLPLALFLIFIILWFNFRRARTTLLVFSTIPIAWSGGFLMIWLYNQPWFLDFQLLGVSMQQLFQIHPINLSVAVWVGFLALFGIASDDGVIMTAYLEEVFRKKQPRNETEKREAIIEAATRRIRPCMMTTATTILALLPVLTSTGRGSDIMIPMAIPTVGGMFVAMITIFIVPVLYSLLIPVPSKEKVLEG